MRLYAKMRGEYNVNPGVDYTATSSTVALEKELNNNNINASSASIHGESLLRLNRRVHMQCGLEWEWSLVNNYI